MSSINPHFTLNYQQPDEYHFSHDSVFLARRAFELTAGQDFNDVLDLCAGCGVIGIDYLFHLKSQNQKLPDQVDFLEVQCVYQESFAQNVRHIPELKRFRFLNFNYAQVEDHPDLKDKYDLILCNPPFFNADQGKLSPSEFKNRCRFFIDSDLDHLISAIRYLLKPGTSAYVLLKESDLIGRHDGLKFTRLEKIRTTDLYQIQKNF